MGDGVVNPVSFPIPLSSSCHQLPSWENGHSNNRETLKHSFSGMLTAAGLKSACETYISFLLVNMQLSISIDLMVVWHSTLDTADCWILEWEKTWMHIAEFHIAVRNLQPCLQSNNFLCYNTALGKLKVVFPTFPVLAISTKAARSICLCQHKILKRFEELRLNTHIELDVDWNSSHAWRASCNFLHPVTFNHWSHRTQTCLTPADQSTGGSPGNERRKEGRNQ